jgi:hypothetical protein
MFHHYINDMLGFDLISELNITYYYESYLNFISYLIEDVRIGKTILISTLVSNLIVCYTLLFLNTKRRLVRMERKTVPRRALIVVAGVLLLSVVVSLMFPEKEAE